MWRLEPLMLLLPLRHRTVMVVVWTLLRQQGGGRQSQPHFSRDESTLVDLGHDSARVEPGK
jgi:hypothetical protein